MNIVELHNVDKHYAGVRALSRLSLALPEGEVLGLFGHNGAGKTTTIKLILGLIEPSDGEVRVFGERPGSRGAREQRRALGFLQENVSFYEQLSGDEVLRYFARLKGASRAQCRELLDEVGLGDAAKRRVKTYSKGMRQRRDWPRPYSASRACCCSTNPPWAWTRSRPGSSTSASPGSRPAAAP
ncbi:ABC transporter ATP-binding protein [Marinobacterium aestuariivivens]|uniref:ABC transporter ATP-binding protein n=1 Tax=Marinobacterium aestuariivivens TaxID=1698799 RepID=A0ABW2A529_9GAMM